MKQSTKDLLNEIKAYPWFSRHGIEGDRYNIITSYPSALKAINTKKWSSLTTAVMNRYFDYLRVKVDRGSDEYISLSNELRDKSYAIAEQVIVDHDNKYQPLLRSIKGVVCGAAFECEFSDVAPLFWYIPVILPVYQKGHIVCGWDGPKVDNTWQGKSYLDLPTGKLKVY